MTALKPGTIHNRFTARDGREVILRTPKWDDLDDMLDFINSLVEEEVMITVNQKQTRESEIDWLARKLTNLEKDKIINVVAEVEGRMVGSCEVEPRPGRFSHVGILGISVKQGYREVGIGQELMKEVERQAAQMGLESIILEVFDTNDRAVHVYQKMGYTRIGAIPDGIKYKGEYVDSVYMVKKLCSS
ncbi:MAG: GNAT family N-acetyltransferase [Candidatus Bathyarchaeota archaeon]